MEKTFQSEGITILNSEPSQISESLGTNSGDIIIVVSADKDDAPEKPNEFDMMEYRNTINFLLKSEKNTQANITAEYCGIKLTSEGILAHKDVVEKFLSCYPIETGTALGWHIDEIPKFYKHTKYRVAQLSLFDIPIASPASVSSSTQYSCCMLQIRVDNEENCKKLVNAINNAMLSGVF